MALMTVFTALIFIGSVPTATLSSNKLWTYGRQHGDRVMDKTTVNQLNDGSPKNIIFELREKIKWFDGTDINKIKV